MIACGAVRSSDSSVGYRGKFLNPHGPITRSGGMNTSARHGPGRLAAPRTSIAATVHRPPATRMSVDLAALVEQRQAEVWRYLRYLGAQASEADDLTQETFLAVAGSHFVERSPRETAAYLRTTARHRFLSLRRKQSREVLSPDLEAAESAWTQAVWNPAADGETWDDQITALRDCVGRLEGRAREAVDLQYREKQSRDAIADRLGMKPDGVKTLLRRTRTLLRECIERATSNA